MRNKLINGNHSLNVVAVCGTRFSDSFMDKPIVSTLHLKKRKTSLPAARIRITSFQGGNNADSCFSAREVSPIENSAILCSRETEVG